MRTLRLVTTGVMVCAVSSRARGQSPVADPRCDSVIAAAKTDSVPAGLFISVRRVDGGDLDRAQSARVASLVGAAFIPPRPFRLTVFSGPVRMRTLRQLGADTITELHAPTLTGIYRVVASASGAIEATKTVRTSLMPGFDSSAAAAIFQASIIPDVFTPPDHSASMTVDIRVASDSTDGAQRLVAAHFPRMPVVNATPSRANPAPIFPEDAKTDSVATGEVVLRFVVNRSGAPELETIEIVRATSLPFVRAALTALPLQRFVPATIRGCAVAQLIDYPFTFLLPDGSESSFRH